MLVEIIGCTGTGKSTIAAKVIQQLENAGLHFDLLNIGGKIRHDFIAFPWFLFYAFRKRRLYQLAHNTLHAQGISIFSKLNLYRNFAKKIGTYARLRKRQNNIIWDEGTVHASHNLFVHADNRPDLIGLKEFADLVPLPNLIVLIRSPIEDVIKRTKKRGHKRARGHEDIATFIKHANQVFEYLSLQEKIKEKLLILDNDKEEDIEELSNIIRRHVIIEMENR